MTGLVIEDGFIVGGDANERITPNFTLKEFKLPDGKYFIHRDVVAALQELRDAYGAPVKIDSQRATRELGKDRDGLFVWVTAADLDALEAAAKALEKSQFAEVTERKGNRVYVQISDPKALPPLLPANAMERALRITAAYETSGDPFTQVTGNFDGAGLSFGPLQVNFKTGTLKDLFERFERADANAMEKCFTNPDDYATWKDVLKMSRTRQVDWADGLSTGRRKTGFSQPWKTYLENVGRVPKFQRETLTYAYDTYGRKLIRALSWLQGLTPIRIDNFACLSALFDLCVQQGSLDKAHDAIRARVALEHPRDQFELIHIAVEERGKKALRQYRADTVSRRLGILYQEPRTVEISGVTATRVNPRMYLVKNSAVRDMDKYLI